ncbi:MAG: glycosyltransferase, partial [Hymenobacter sp.]
MPTVPLSVVVITFNEEANIARCLAALADVADEVLVVDSFSTDGTVEICRQHGARVVQNAFAGYVQQKNFATDQAQLVGEHFVGIELEHVVELRLVGGEVFLLDVAGKGILYHAGPVLAADFD